MNRLWIILLTISSLNLVAPSCANKQGGSDASLDVTTEGDDGVPIDYGEENIIAEEPAPESVPMVIDTLAVDNAKSAKTLIALMNASADSAKYAEGIMHRIASDSPNYVRRLLKNQFDYFIVVDKPSMNVVLFDKYGREHTAYKMACARNYGTKREKNDCRTPEGFLKAGNTYDATDWLYTDENGVTSPTKGVYGPRFIRVVNPITSTIGIHGTGSPWSLGNRSSHGCIRVHNESILDLVKYVKYGMPIIVNPSARDRKANKEAGIEVEYINIGKPERFFSDPKKEEEEKKEDSSVTEESTATDTTPTTPTTPAGDDAVITTFNPDEPEPASAPTTGQ